MKKSSLELFMLLVILLMFPSVSFSQVIIDVPTEFGSEGSNNLLTRFILSDTTETGERNHPNAIYRLARGEYYEISPLIRIDFNFTLIGAKEPKTTRPPMVIRGVDPQGAYARTLFDVVGDSVSVTFRNIIFQGVQDDNQITTNGTTLMGVHGLRDRIVVDNCIINGMTGHSIRGADSDHSTFIMKNCKVRNSVPLSNFFSGAVYSASNKTTHQDTMLFINNTFLNVHDKVLRTKSYTDLIEFTHNTFIMGTTKSLQMNWAPNVIVRDNIFYDYMSTGTMDSELYSDGDLQSIVKIYKAYPEQLLENSISEKDRKAVYKNNVYAWSQKLGKFWSDYVPEVTNYDNGAVHLIDWMCDSTRINFFENTTEYPHFVHTQNDSLDPGFDQSVIDSLLAKQLQYLEIFRVKGYSDLSKAKERFYAPGGAYFEVPWPLPENLAYTNQAVQTHAEGGFPAGDLNWFPDKKVQWETWKMTDVKNKPIKTIHEEYRLAQNYPNPFNPSTVINFTISKSGNTRVEVFNILGQKVITLFNENLKAGSHKVKFDASGLTSGIYFYKLQSGSYSDIKKMMLLK